MYSKKMQNHTGYPHGVEGDVLNGTQLQSILSGLERNNLLQGIGHILTGYIGSVSFLRAVTNVVKTIRSATSSHVRYVCDPVLGDNHQFYVPPELVDVYRTEVIPLADIVTPNQFEVEQLTGIRIRSMEDAQRACQKLHDLGPKLVVITSISFPEEEDKETHDKRHPATIAILASKRGRCKRENADAQEQQEENNYEIWCIDSPFIEGVFTGTGDLCAALLLAWTEMESNDLQCALEKVIGTMFSVIRRTAESVGVTVGSSEVASRELCLIQSKRDIEDPPALYKAIRLC